MSKTKTPRSPSSSTRKVSLRFWFTFDAESSQRPLIWEMSQRYPISFNIRNSSITDRVGVMALELTGIREEIDKAVNWMRKKGVQVDPIEINTIEG